MSAAKKEALRRWLVQGRSASGDFYKKLGLFDHKPSDAELKELVSAKHLDADGWSEDEGPGDYGSFVTLSILQFDANEFGPDVVMGDF